MMDCRPVRKCHKCGSTRVAPILYGMPASWEDLQEKIKAEKAWAGGCCLFGADPRYHCFACGKDIGAPPLLYSSRKAEDYRDIVTSVRFISGNYRGIDQDEVFFQKTADGVTLSVSPDFRRRKTPCEREAAEEEWRALMDRLFCRLYIHEWKKNWHPRDYAVLDGYYWALELRLTGGRVRNYHGSNAYPPKWAALANTFEPFLDACPDV